MIDIFHDFPINAPAKTVFDSVARPQGLNAWWTLESSGKPAMGAEYKLYFGPEYDWRAAVSACVPHTEFELRMTTAVPDWQNTRVGFQLEEADGVTQVRFHHTGWPESNKHYRISCYCWAMYLRILKRHIEHGESVPYATRLDV